MAINLFTTLVGEDLSCKRWGSGAGSGQGVGRERTYHRPLSMVSVVAEGRDPSRHRPGPRHVV